MNLKLGYTNALINACKQKGLSRAQCAYVLATAYWETARTMKPIYERGARSYFNKYEPGTKLGKRLGNTEKGDGYKYRGAGYVQLTGRGNFVKAGRNLGLDLVGNPALAIDPVNAAKIAVTGMVEGWFTGKKLSDYINATKADFHNARRIINGTDKSAQIADLARQYFVDLEGIYKPASAKKPAQAPLLAIEPKPAPAPVPVKDKEMIQRVQIGLKLLNYNPGGADGIIGPLTAGAIRIFRSDNGLPEGDFIDDELIAALASAKPREMVAARANATQGQVAKAVPEARVHWWNRIGAAVVGGGTAAAGAVDYIAPATGYLQPVRDFLGDIPAWAWVIGIVVIALVLYEASAYGSKKATQAYQSGDRR